MVHVDTRHKGEPANPERGEVLIRLGGTVYRLRPSYAAIVEVRKETGVPLGQSFSRIRAFDLVEAAIILGAILRANGHKLTNEEVGEMLIRDGLESAIGEVASLLEHMLTGGVQPGALGETMATAEMEKSPSVASSE